MITNTNTNTGAAHTVAYPQTARVANLMAKPMPFAFRLAALTAMGGENASYPYGQAKAQELAEEHKWKTDWKEYFTYLEEQGIL